jgi:pyruvate/2-oxoglutarate dehydrogenase complex dihydrolipoamide dehydrogenase (E3) component
MYTCAYSTTLHVMYILLLSVLFTTGDCLNVGCVPSKALIKAASVAHTLHNCEEYGITIHGTVNIDFGKVSV